MTEAVIVSAARSPIGRANKGRMAGLRPDDLALQMVRAALADVPALDPNEISDLMIGCALPGGEQGFNLGRVVAVLAGLDEVPGTTVTRYCASSLQTTRMAFHAIKAGEGDAFISAGVETVSRFGKGNSNYIPGQDLKNPIFATAMDRSEVLAGGGARWRDPRIENELPDVYVAMGHTAENVQQVLEISRREQDEFAARSQQLTQEAIASGFWKTDITPVQLPDGTIMDADECPRGGVTETSLAGLSPVFRPDGTVTAGNCCALNDGAAALVIVSDTRAAQLGLKPLARIVSTGVTGLSPELMGLGPVGAVKQCLSRAGMSVSDVDLFEINEAFAVQALGSANLLGIDIDKLNVNGGAIALGHPFGMTGARITSTLINSLRWHDKTFGVETMCVGGGMGMAMLIERLD